MPKSAGKTREYEEEESEHIFIKEDSMKESIPPPKSPSTEKQKEGF